MAVEVTARARGFRWFNLTQFLGALNDNVFKLFVVFFLIDSRGKEAAATAGALGLALLALPFLLFSAWAGILADRYREDVPSCNAAEGGRSRASCWLGVLAFMLRNEIAIYAVHVSDGHPEHLFRSREVRRRAGTGEQGGACRGRMEFFRRSRISPSSAAPCVAPWLSQVIGGNYLVASGACVVDRARGIC
jgi:acyl-[acyl-carrier-protein]-phospholipid O-acyltransferase / long-chain-fatty-acid--[acyl-carrier-protein] ligase